MSRRELKRHMFTVEEKILESLGWAPGSSFYKLPSSQHPIAPAHLAASFLSQGAEVAHVNSGKR
jgi:hypothetical protein